MYLGPQTRLIISPLFNLSAITVKPQLFPFCVFSVGVFFVGFRGGVFCQLVLSFPSPPVPSLFRVTYYLAASAYSPETGDVGLNPLSRPRKENYVRGMLCFSWLLKEKSEPCLIFC